MLATHWHLETLRMQIQYHQRECGTLKDERDSERASLQKSQERCETLVKDNVRLGELSWIVGWLNVVGNGLVAIGGGVFGIAGCWPNLPDRLKIVLASVGATMAGCGVLVTILAFASGKRARQGHQPTAGPVSELTSRPPL